jgi:hypothetical protein
MPTCVFQLSSYELSTIHYQLSTIHYELSITNHEASARVEALSSKKTVLPRVWKLRPVKKHYFHARGRSVK